MGILSTKQTLQDVKGALSAFFWHRVNPTQHTLLNYYSITFPVKNGHGKIPHVLATYQNRCICTQKNGMSSINPSFSILLDLFIAGSIWSGLSCMYYEGDGITQFIINHYSLNSLLQYKVMSYIVDIRWYIYIYIFTHMKDWQWTTNKASEPPLVGSPISRRSTKRGEVVPGIQRDEQ